MFRPVDEQRDDAQRDNAHRDDDDEIGEDDIVFSDTDEEDNDDPDEPLYDENSDDEVEISLATDLAKWVCKSRTPIIHVNGLLEILHKHGVYGLPKSCATLMKTPTTKVKIREVPPGQYVHFGIETHIQNNKYPFLENLDEVVIDIGIDGLKVFNSSSLTLWPILGSFVNRPNVSPFLIGCYCGYAQPIMMLIFIYLILPKK